MEKIQFTTNINCGSCVKKVTPFLDEAPSIQTWNVDTNNPNKILTVEGNGLQAEAVIELIEDIGFDIAIVK